MAGQEKEQTAAAIAETSKALEECNEELEKMTAEEAELSNSLKETQRQTGTALLFHSIFC